MHTKERASSLLVFEEEIKEEEYNSNMASQKIQKMREQPQEVREELDEKARQGETVVPGGTGGKSLEAQEHLAEGNLYIYNSFIH